VSLVCQCPNLGRTANHVFVERWNRELDEAPSARLRRIESARERRGGLSQRTRTGESEQVTRDEEHRRLSGGLTQDLPLFSEDPNVN